MIDREAQPAVSNALGRNRMHVLKGVCQMRWEIHVYLN